MPLSRPKTMSASSLMMKSAKDRLRGEVTEPQTEGPSGSAKFLGGPSFVGSVDASCTEGWLLCRQ